MPNSISPTVESLVERAGRLYTRPAVAMEIVRLTAQPAVDATAIRDCMAGDPALTAKLLRVVNSSIYGLKGEVSNLTQAVALVGVRPLKLLVLGFSLPDDLLEQIEADSLRYYWTQAVTRSVVAKRLAERPGAPPEWQAIADEALVVGLLEGVGQLVLLGELGESYASVMRRVHEEQNGPTLSLAETKAVGFDHRELSAALMRDWNLPDKLAAAIEHQAQDQAARADQPLEAVLELAGRIASLVVDHRINALPALVERGESLCGLTRQDIQEVMQEIQPKTNQLAEALGLELLPESDYAPTIAEAHALLSDAAEGAAGRLLGAAPDTDDEQLCGELLQEISGLSDTMQAYLQAGSRSPDPTAAQPAHAHAARQAVRAPHRQVSEASVNQLSRLVASYVESCRTGRMPLSLAIVELGSDEPQAMAALRRWWKSREDAGTTAEWVAVSGQRIAVLMPNIERREAVKVWTAAVEAYAAFQGDLDVGVAGVTLPSKGFAPESLIEPAARCLDAAVSMGVAAVKSIEVY